MVGFVLQRAFRRRAFCRSLPRCIRTASQVTASAAERLRQAEETSIETLTAKWQPHWDSLHSQWNQLRPNDKGKAYVLPMFPYPSGTLHLGHLRVYTISDVLARFKHMQGYDVLHPIGWDAFGLPAENAAIERGVHPEKWTLQNIESMKAQMKQMGGRWDWDTEIRTCDPDFYKHTQRLFLMLHERGLAYQAESLVNYDPVDQTVLANEQVDANGCSWRSGAKVEKVMLKQWFLRIKDYQEPLLDDLKALAKDGRWPEKVLAMQKNWIGKSQGTKLWFDVERTDGEGHFDSVEVFTTRADTLFGVQYIALSLNHPIVQQLALENAPLRAFLERGAALSPDTKEGFLLPDLVARNPIFEQVDGVDSALPVYVAPYVLDDYGSGAIMGVPGHDTRDHAFWRFNADKEPVKVVITSKPDGVASSLVPGAQDKPMTEKGFVAANVGRFLGLPSSQAAQKVVKEIRASGKRAEATANWRLRDWLISRQRYWGTPIPIIHCTSCGPVPVPDHELPVKLPSLPDSFFDGRKGNPLAEDETWKKTTCPKCDGAAERETDTMDTFMDSSWYFFRFLDPHNDAALVDPHKANEGMQVDLYVGGVEHAILHLLYARFISKFLASTSTWPEGLSVQGEPFKQLITQGMVHGETFTNPENGRPLRPEEVDFTVKSSPIVKANGLIPTISYEKMSKSKYNGVDPGETIARYGADATRAHMLFQAPVGDVLEWDAKKITGVQRWLQRTIRISSASWIPDGELANFEVPGSPDRQLLQILRTLSDNGIWPPLDPVKASTELTDERLLDLLHEQEKKLWIITQQMITSVTKSYSQTYSLNTIVSDLMRLLNTLTEMPHCSAATPYLKWYSAAHLVRMMAPIAPGVAEEAWQMLNRFSASQDQLGNSAESRSTSQATVFAAGFPTADLDIVPRLTQTITCVVQVDGKRKFEVEIERGLDSKTSHNQKHMSRWLLSTLLETEEGREWLDPETGKVWKLSKNKNPHTLFKYVPADWGVIIVRDGRLCNLVSPKTTKVEKSKDGAGAGKAQTQAVSQDSNEQDVRGLNAHSNKDTAGTIRRVDSLGKAERLGTSKDGLPKQAQGPKLSTSRRPPPSTPPRLYIDEVHARVDTLMSSLAPFLRPCYVPPSTYPITTDAIVGALQEAGRVSTHPSAEMLLYYKNYLSAPQRTPRNISKQYILRANASALAGMTRLEVLRKYNAIFVEHLYLSCHPRPAPRPRLPTRYRFVIAYKLRRYRDYVNALVRARDGGELDVALGMQGSESMSELEMDFGKIPEEDVEQWTTKHLQREFTRVEHVWKEILELWARNAKAPDYVGKAKDETTPQNAEPKEATEEVDEDGAHWLWLAGENETKSQNVERKESIEEVDEDAADWVGLAREDERKSKI